MFGRDVNEHCQRVHQIVERLRDFELRIKSKKCEFLKEEIQFLGHRISFNNIRQAESKIQAIASAEPPHNIKQMRSFLGLANYYRKFIKDFNSIACPLYKATSAEGKTVEWNDERQFAFEELKRRLTDTNNVLALPNFDLPFVLETDASDVGIGAVLSQELDGNERPIAYFSRHLNKAEKN